MYTIRKQFKFEMAHQLSEAFSACCSETIHGHSYVLEVFFTGFRLDSTGMIIDFGEVKDILKSYINKWDHALVMPRDMDDEYLNMLMKYNKKIILTDYNPTAEEMAKDMYYYIKSRIHELSKVRLHETTTGWAEYWERSDI